MSNSGFELSAMKNSFSLSSLRVAAAPSGGRLDASLERPYHSLTKKRKEPSREAWRRSWGSAASGGSAGDDLWPLLQHHYDYIMDNQIIDSCREANGELLSGNSQALLGMPCQLNPILGFNRQWSLSQFIAEFTDICQWLTHVQEEIYSSPKNLSDRNLRVTRMSELVSLEPRRAKFLEQATAILERIPEARAEVIWRVEHLNNKWESLRLLLSPEQPEKDGDHTDTIDTAHELRCLRRWLHSMEGRLPPPSLAAARSAGPRELGRKLREHQVLQRDVECHRRVVSSAVRLCDNSEAASAARALERRWHLLYLRAIEWQCHLEACLKHNNQQVGFPDNPVSDSDEEPALKQPRLSRRGSPRRARLSPNIKQNSPIRGQNAKFERGSSCDTRESYSEEEQEYVERDWRHSGSESDSELVHLTVQDFGTGRFIMATAHEDECRVPSSTGHVLADVCSDQAVPTTTDCIDGVHDIHNSSYTTGNDEGRKTKTPPTVIKRKKPVDSSKFNQSDRKSKHLATFYFKHHDTDSDRQMIETDEKSQEESSEEEWTYVGGKVVNDDSADIMTSSIELQSEVAVDENIGEINKMIETSEKKVEGDKLESPTPDLLRVDHTRKENIERLVLQAEVIVQKKAQQQMASAKKNKGVKNFKPIVFDEDAKSVTCRNKMSRIKEWLSQNTNGQSENNQGTESYDASGEYTTESEVDTSLTSEERNLHSSMDMSTSTCTVTPTHHAKVTLRKKRVGGGTGTARPWSVSCLSQLSGVGTGLATTPTSSGVYAHMSISESALNTLHTAVPDTVVAANSNSKLRGSQTTVQGHVSSTNTITEACTSCQEANEAKHCWLRRKRLKLRRRAAGPPCGINERSDRLVKSLSFSGRLGPDLELDKNERSTVSEPATSRKHRSDTTSTSGNDSDKELRRQQLTAIAHLRRSIEKTYISNNREHDNIILEQSEPSQMAPSFKLGPAGGPVRPRLARSTERERVLLGLSLGDPSQLWDLSIDRDSDIDKSVNTAGTEEHSSFSEQAWDFYQEKYNSEPYSEAPDSDAARRLLEFGDDYRAFLDSQSDCCSSLSAQPEHDQSPGGTRRRRPLSDVRHKRPSKSSPVDTPTRKPKKTMSSAERKKSLLDSLERSRNSASLDSNEGRRRKPDNKNGRKFSPESIDLLNALNRRRHSSNMTSDEINSSLEYNEANNKPDIIDSLGRRRRNFDGESQKKLSLSELRRRSTESADSEGESSSPKKHSRRSKEWRRGSDSESDEVRSMIRRSTSQLEETEAIMAHQEASPDVLHSFDYTDIVARCRENMACLEAALASGLVSMSRQRDIRTVSARWSALRAAATRRGGARRIRRELAALRDTLADICESDDVPLQLHTKSQLHRRIDELKERLSRLLECKVSMLKLTVSVRRALGDIETDESAGGLAAELAAMLTAWDGAHQRTSSELLSLEKALCAWAEWEGALRELQGALRGDLATLRALRDRTPSTDRAELAARLRGLAAELLDKKSGSTSDSLSDSGISDGDSEGAGGRARRLSALKELARRLQAALAPNSPAHKAIAKRMEQTENEVRALQDSCRALVEQSAPCLHVADEKREFTAVANSTTGAGDPDYTPRGGAVRWLWRVLRTSLPIQLCLVALLLAAWLVERPRCCDAINSIAATLTPQLRYVRGPPPV